MTTPANRPPLAARTQPAAAESDQAHPTGAPR